MNVDVIDVHKGFAGAGPNALKGVSFTAESGHITSLVGASGCGKTTTLRCIAGLEAIDEGEIHLDGQPVSTRHGLLVPTAKRNIGMVFQSYALWPHLTVAENIAFGLRMRRWSRTRIRARVQEVLSTINLAGFGDRYPGQLSGGQQQRVAVGRAMAYQPTLLLMDEPLANLDTHLRAQMRQEIRRLQRDTGVTMVYVTHDRSEAIELSDRVVILDQGEVVQIGSPNELFEKPRSVLVARFLGHSNFLNAKALGTDSGAIILDTAIGRCHLGSQRPAADELALLVHSDAVRLGVPGERVPHGWLEAKARVLSSSPAPGGTNLTLSIKDGSLEIFVPENQQTLVQEEMALFIDPGRCQILEGAAGHA